MWLIVNCNSRAQIFKQDFSESKSLSSYINSCNPSDRQWNAIGTSGSGVTVSVVNHDLRFSRTTGNSGSFSRTSDFSPAPTGMMYCFSISVSGNTTAQTSAAVFQVGSGFGTANSGEPNTNVYARLGVNFSATDGTFSLRNIDNLANSSNFSGTVYICWALNNTGNSVDYTAPDGTTESLADDTWDLWVGTTKVFDDQLVTTPTQTMTDLKFAFTAGSGIIILDNFIIYGSNEGIIPVELTAFKSKTDGRNVNLFWETVTEKNCNGFEVQRLKSGENNWISTGFVKAAGLSVSPRQYTFPVKNLQEGKYKFRLKVIDYNGTFEYSKVIEAEISSPENFKVGQNYPNPFIPSTKINYQIPVDSKVIFELFSITGQRVAEIVNEEVKAGYHTIDLQPSIFRGSFSSGIYIYRITVTEKATGKSYTASKRMLFLK